MSQDGCLVKILVNGEPQEVGLNVSVDGLLVSLGYGGKAVAVAVNRDFVPRSSYPQTRIQEGDEIEILAPMQGG